MSDLVITLHRVECDEITDDFLEGTADEFGYRIVVFDAAGKSQTAAEELPMPGFEKIEPRTVKDVGKQLCRLGPDHARVHVEFWDKDNFSSDDLLGRIEVERAAGGELAVRAGEHAQDEGGGSFYLTGEDGRYRVVLSFELA